jgi:integrase
VRQRNNGLRKLCGCARRNWPKCAHAWYFNFKPRGGIAYQFSLDVEIGMHLKTKEAAQAEVDRIRNEIRAGTFVRAAEKRQQAIAALEAAGVEPATEIVTLEHFTSIYLERVSQVRDRNKSWTNDRHMFGQLSAFVLTDGTRLGERPVGSVAEDDLEAFLAALRLKGRAASTRNKYVQLLKASFRWAEKKGYVARNPISEDAEIRRAKVAQRNRRLQPDVLDKDRKIVEYGEEHRLLAAAGPRLQNLIVAALESCCRRGELLSLQWRDVSLERGDLTIRGEKAKDGDTRVLPISVRLAAVLKMAKTDPAGEDYRPDDYVFGELGRQVDNTKRAWETCVLKAHGYVPAWQKKALAPASRAALRTIDLHFHDLRHEGASRLLESGWPLHHVQEMLGHSSLEQTSTYLNVQRSGLRDSMRRTDEARSRCEPVVNEAETERPSHYNGESNDPGKTLLN